MSKVEIDIGQLVNSCFVIMPFSAIFDAEYTNVIRPAIETAGLTPVRADEIYSKPQVMADIWKSLRSSRMVIAELSDRNINVFYEVGLAHALGKPVIIITRNEEDVPFDLKALRYLYYNTNNPSWGETLRNDLKEMIKKLLKEKEFGTVFEGIKVAGVTEYQKTPALSPNVPPQLYDLTGVWEGQMKQNGQVYDVKLDLSHKEPDLTGTMIVCYASSGGAIVVQQSMKGMVIKDNVKLYGVSYTYVRQGASHKYAMDSFSGKILNGGNTISGTSMDESGNKGEFSLTRLLEPESKKG